MQFSIELFLFVLFYRTQAEKDLAATDNDMNVDNVAYNWVCFKAQEVMRSSWI